jgi:hypothetical protein
VTEQELCQETVAGSSCLRAQATGNQKELLTSIWKSHHAFLHTSYTTNRTVYSLYNHSHCSFFRIILSPKADKTAEFNARIGYEPSPFANGENTDLKYIKTKVAHDRVLEYCLLRGVMFAFCSDIVQKYILSALDKSRKLNRVW